MAQFQGKLQDGQFYVPTGNLLTTMCEAESLHSDGCLGGQCLRTSDDHFPHHLIIIRAF